MSVKKVNIKCWNCSTEFTANYEVNPHTIEQGIDTYGNTIKIGSNHPRLITINVGIKCPNPECGKKAIVSVKIPK